MLVPSIHRLIVHQTTGDVKISECRKSHPMRDYEVRPVLCTKTVCSEMLDSTGVIDN